MNIFIKSLHFKIFRIKKKGVLIFYEHQYDIYCERWKSQNTDVISYTNIKRSLKTKTKLSKSH